MKPSRLKVSDITPQLNHRYSYGYTQKEDLEEAGRRIRSFRPFSQYLATVCVPVLSKPPT